MKLLAPALVFLFAWLPLASAKTDYGGATYQGATIVAAQEALARLSYDIGKPDGKWSAKTRDALNDLRAKNGLPPADTFTGSSLALIHRLSPGATTLPHPGLIVTDVVARRAFLNLGKNRMMTNLLCLREYGTEPRLNLITAASVPVKVVKTDHQTTMRVSTLRWPMRSPRAPVGTSNNA